MQFKVLQPIITKEELTKILEYYNSKKEENENPLKLLDRAEGGFKIDVPEDKWEKDLRGFITENTKIQQMRWKNGYLTSMGYCGFNLKQYMLLYDAFVYALPPGEVILEN
jgi:hypothetical protein